ncbi:hypothetical protein P1S61_09080 [Streptomyces sp. ME08-AFT2]|uniref:hypothetical protein n=1 Tax=Streptomyces sp. ME08-AFT2 TaxID=3028683 RepID=UPI0029BAE19E|nr:hypothetical protein [Streptomyces sp. ME08-AFT2]MDX3309246.1 hypothetical protein [Streptomyces sp. ME08-AFT2]
MATLFPLLKTVPTSPSLGKVLADTSPALKFAAAGSALASMGAAKTVGSQLAETVGKQLAYRSTAVSIASTSLEKLSLIDTPATRLAKTGVMGDSLASLVLKLPEYNPFGDAIASMGFANLVGSRLADCSPVFGISPTLKELSLFDSGIARLSTQFTALDTFAEAMSSFARRSPMSILGSSALERLSLFDTTATRLASSGIMGSGLASFRLRMPEFNPFGDAVAAAWNHTFDMPGLTGLLRGLPDGLLEPLRSITRLIERLGAPIVWLARAALDAYLHGDHEPMREFLYTHLRLRPHSEDHAQALAMALLLREWEEQVDLQDADAVRAVLRKCAREGNDLDGDHQVMGYKIGHMKVGIELLSPTPGPEDLAIATVVPWAERFDNRHVRNVTGRLKDVEQRVARVWAENDPINWRQAPELVGQDVAMGERVRRKLLRLGDDIVTRAKAQVPGAN